MTTHLLNRTTNMITYKIKVARALANQLNTTVSTKNINIDEVIAQPFTEGVTIHAQYDDTMLVVEVNALGTASITEMSYTLED